MMIILLNLKLQIVIYLHISISMGRSKASALLPWKYSDITQEGGFQLSFGTPFDPTFHL